MLGFDEARKRQNESPKKTKADLIPAGVQAARCYSIVDLGTQHWDYMGQPKTARKLCVTWEIPKFKKVFREEKGEEPLVIGRTYTISMYEKSNLVKDFTSWFSDEQPDGDIENWIINHTLGRTALLTISHENKPKDGDDRWVQVIAGIAPLPEEMKCEDPLNTPIFFSIDKFDQKVFDSLPAWQQEDIKKSDEYQNMGERPAVAADIKEDFEPPKDAEDHDLPF